MKRTLSPSFIVANTGMLWLATAIASCALWPIYQSAQLVIMVVVATVLASALAVLGALLRWSTLVVLIVLIAVYLAVGVPLAIPDSAIFGVLPSTNGLVALLSGTALGWKQLLTITLPVGSYQALLVPALILVLGTVTAALSAALRSRRGDLAALGPIALFLAATAFGPDTAVWPVQLSLGLLAAILLWLIWRRAYRGRAAIRSLETTPTDVAGAPIDATHDRGSGFRTVIGAGIILVVAGTTAVGAAIALPPTAPRQVIRSSMVQPFDPRDYPSPLSGFRSYEKPPTAADTMLTVSGLPKGDRIRIATLDDYDGVVYSVGSDQPGSASGSFTRVPYTFDQSALRGTQVTVSVTVGDYSGVWLPTVGQFESISFAGSHAATLRDSFYYNDNSGTAAVIRPITSGDQYTLKAVVPYQPNTKQQETLTPGTAELPRIGVLPDELSTVLDGYVSGANTPGQRLAAMIAALKKNGYISHGVLADEPLSRSGHAADRITELLSDQRMIGDQEQYAVTAALMARQLGFPARVVFGFVPDDSDAASSGTVVRGSDISAWIEVDTASYGWVTIDPTPPVRAIPAEQPQEPTQIARPQSPVQPPVQEPQVRDSQVSPDSTQDAQANPNEFLLILFAVLRIAGWVLLGVAVALAPFLAIVAAKWRRRFRRRRARLPAERISGGWREFEDSVIDHGYTPPGSPTRVEVAEAVGGMHSLVLASVADRAVFAPDQPNDADADRLWRSVHELRASLGVGLTRWQRIKALISLRSLGGYSVKEWFRR
jgi:transglutaminase-like putative cysteine protease